MQSEAQVVCLSDDGQAREVNFAPGGLHEVNLHEVVRCTPRIVAGAMSFQVGSYKPFTACHLKEDDVGPPLRADIFEMNGSEDVMDCYGKHTADALEDLLESFPGLDLHNRVAILVPDLEFRESFVSTLARILKKRPPKGQPFQIKNTCEAFSCIAGTVQCEEGGWLICDTIDQFDGLEKMFVALVGLDQQIEDPQHAKRLESRSMMYRGITRAQYQVIVINEYLEGGWLQFLTRVHLEEEEEMTSVGAGEEPAAHVSKKSGKTSREHGDLESQILKRRQNPVKLTEQVAVQGLLGGRAIEEITQAKLTFTPSCTGKGPARVPQSIWQPNKACKQTDQKPAFNPFPSAHEKIASGNKNDAMEAVAQDGLLLHDALDELKADKDVVLAAVYENGKALEFADDALKSDKEVVLAALVTDASALKFAKGGLDQDADCLKAAGGPWSEIENRHCSDPEKEQPGQLEESNKQRKKSRKEIKTEKTAKFYKDLTDALHTKVADFMVGISVSDSDDD